MVTGEGVGSRGVIGARRLIADTDWDRLKVLIGPEEGCPTVPELLTTLIEGTPPAQARALYDLSEAVNHQDSIVEATAPAMSVIAALLTDPSTACVRLPPLPHRADSASSFRAGLLRLMVSVADGVDHASEAAGRRFGFEPSAATLRVRAIRPGLFSVVDELLDDPDPDVRLAAALAALPALTLPFREDPMPATDEGFADDPPF
ncbi:hypothetical protein [Actinomadura verrucosospora]|uniref:Uncharacterized protein n=1 Tax=Actinomadura verrucosospora TaxID=46165 RepID=A0A7D3VUT3_ACTVE|nr:hypothetical protein [Actinomadura verrucosospora]QKG23198.1 hypothetical protein ACTIVE_4839 [Actinomadura verrucosospora]